jgi:hypothetical protein
VPTPSNIISLDQACRIAVRVQALDGSVRMVGDGTKDARWR